MNKKIFMLFIIAILCLSPVAAANWDSFAGGIDHNAYRDEGSDFCNKSLDIQYGISCPFISCNIQGLYLCRF